VPKYGGGESRPLILAEGFREALDHPGAPAIVERCRRVLELDRSGRDATGVGRDALALAVALAEAEVGGLWVRRRRQGSLEILAAHPPERAPSLALTLKARAVERCLGGFPVVSPPHPIARTRALLEAPDWESALLVPLEADTMSGLLAVGRRTGSAPLAADRVESVIELASLVAIPLAGALRRQALGQRIRQLQAVRRVGAAVAVGATLEELFRVTGHALGDLLAFDLAALVVADRRRDTGAVLVAERHRLPRAFEWSVDWAGTVTGRVLRTEQPVIVADLTREAPQVLPFVREYTEARALLSVPLHLGAGAAGALLLLSRTAGCFRRREARLVAPITRMLAAGIRDVDRQSIRSGRQAEGSGPERRPDGTEPQAEIWRLAGALVHQIRNPLTVIGTTVQYLRDQRLLSEEHRPLLEAAEAKVREMDEALEGLLTLSRPLALRQEPTAVEALLSEVAEFIQTRAAMHSVEVRVDAAAGTPEAMIDRRYLGQALLTLALGALEAMPGGGRLVLAARPAADTGQVLLSVADTGDGLDGRDPAALLGPSDGGELRGARLGLAITRRLVEAHGGTLEASRDAAGGATYILSLPAAA
jgi:signal transduction histidine kinase